MDLKTICIQGKLNLEQFSQYLEQNTGKNHAYHNNEHLLNVASNTLYLCRVLGVEGESRRHLVAAALLHDINHTGDASNSDRVNINRAILFLKENAENLLDSGLNPKVIGDLIKVTQHPSPRVTRINDIILQDADVLYLVRTDDDSTLASYIQALMNETGKPGSFVSTAAFVKEHGFYSTPGWNLWQKSVWKQWDTADLQELDQKHGFVTPDSSVTFL